MKPNFFIIGAAKCGTTSFFNWLKAHPGIGMSKIKEPNFFAIDSIYQRGLQWYESLFDGIEGKKAIGEASVRYSQNKVPHAPKRIYDYSPQAHLIYLVRHPINQLESHFLEAFKYTHRNLSFEKTLKTSPLFIDACCYWKQLNFYRNYFSDAKILVLFFEDLVTNPEGMVKRACKFLDIDPELPPTLMLKPYNISESATRPSSFHSLVKKIPFHQLGQKILPSQIQKVLSSAGRKKLPPRPQWSPQLWKWVINKIKEDTYSILEYCNKPSTYWGSFESWDT